MVKQCRCGHHRLAHRGPRSECVGSYTTGERNPVGVKIRELCPCLSFRPSDRSWWERRITKGTEEYRGAK